VFAEEVDGISLQEEQHNVTVWNGMAVDNGKNGQQMIKINNASQILAS
jgi:hypothetical protein